jgi:hypothetical protein
LAFVPFSSSNIRERIEAFRHLDVAAGAANALNLKIPQSVLYRADKVIR